LKFVYILNFDTSSIRTLKINRHYSYNFI